MHSSAALQLVHPSAERDLAAAEVAAAAFLRALGISLDSESLAGTAARMARGYAELFTPRAFDLTTFPNDEGYDELVISATCPCDRCASTTCYPSSGSPTSGICPAAHHRAIQAGPRRRALRLPASTPGTAHQTDRRLARPHSCSPAVSAWSSRLEHSCMTLRGVHAAGSSDHHLRIAGRPARGPPFTSGVLRTHWRQHLTARRPIAQGVCHADLHPSTAALVGCPRIRTQSGCASSDRVGVAAGVAGISGLDHRRSGRNWGGRSRAPCRPPCRFCPLEHHVRSGSFCRGAAVRPACVAFSASTTAGAAAVQSTLSC